MYSIGIDLGGTKIGAGLLDERGSLLTSRKIATDAHEGPEVLDCRIRRGETGSAAEVGHMTVQMDGPLCSCGNRGLLRLPPIHFELY